jgi:uncharacterized surface protein with fasciclin (FAS1) repeats
MKNLTRNLGILMAMFAIIIVAGCGNDDTNPMIDNNPEPTMDIVETADAAGTFKTLLAAAEAADLVDALKGEGPLTIFAPTDDAFAALPEGTVEALLNDIDALTAILTYHVVPGAVTSAQVANLTSANTLNGAALTITVTSDGRVMIDNATVIVRDIETTNGIIHVIDAVIIPTDSQSVDKSSWFFGGYRFGGGWIAEAIKDGKLQWLTKRLNLYTVARMTGLSTLTTAVKAADLKYTLKRGGTFTLFGPTNDAFAALPEGTLETLLNDIPTLTNILLYHVVPGVVTSDVVVTLTEETMANGETVSIMVGENGVMINDSKVLVVDIQARNGVIHLIDNVLLP